MADLSGSDLLWHLAVLLVSVFSIVIAYQFDTTVSFVFWSVGMLLLLMLRPDE